MIRIFEHIFVDKYMLLNAKALNAFVEAQSKALELANQRIEIAKETYREVYDAANNGTSCEEIKAVMAQPIFEVGLRKRPPYSLEALLVRGDNEGRQLVLTTAPWKVEEYYSLGGDIEVALVSDDGECEIYSASNPVKYCLKEDLDCPGKYVGVSYFAASATPNALLRETAKLNHALEKLIEIPLDSSESESEEFKEAQLFLEKEFKRDYAAYKELKILFFDLYRNLLSVVLVGAIVLMVFLMINPSVG